MGRTQFKQEYPLKQASISALWRMISTPAGLCTWFCDSMSVSGRTYSFSWKGHTQDATLIAQSEYEFIRFRWKEDMGTNSYFEFRITTLELTGTVALVITDTAPDDEVEDAQLLWDNEVEELKRRLGLN